MLTPPRHRADAPGIYVHDTDPAVRVDLIEIETAAIKELIAAAPAERRSELADSCRHPWLRYASGEGRYDLDARYPLHAPGGSVIERSAREYLDAGATLFRLRRLTREEHDQATALLHSDRAETFARLGRPIDDVNLGAEIDRINRAAGVRLAVKHGLAGVDGWHAGPWPAGWVVDDARLDELHDVGGPLLLERIAIAVLRYSAPLRRDESLRFASPGTEPSR